MEARDIILDRLKTPWDVIVIGGGITGAGILKEASQRGLKCLLLEQRDFSWGTSSRSGKLVHGGLRYLKQGQIKTTWHSVREREKLLREYSGLVEPLGFLVPAYGNSRVSKAMYHTGLTIYDLIAMRKSRCRYGGLQAGQLAPTLKKYGLDCGFWFLDARTDDARLVLRVIREGVRLGGTAINYARVEDLIKDRAGRVKGVFVRDTINGNTIEVQGKVVINSTGVWADRVHSFLGSPGKRPGLRPLRGSHLVFPYWRFPISVALGLTHPEDGRSLYVFPWEGNTLVGTTDLDHEFSLDTEPRISQREGKYLLSLVQEFFPSLALTSRDVISTFSGIRPVVNTGQKDPSKESRDHVVWNENGLVTVTGGKLTTFNLLARETLAEAGKWLSSTIGKDKGSFVKPPEKERIELPGDLEALHRQRLFGRYGFEAVLLAGEAERGDFKAIHGTGTLLAEIRWAARHEAVVHLDDLLLRRTRIGLLAPGGCIESLDRIRSVVQPVLGWDNQRWEDEVTRYVSLWQESYSPYLIN
ncbi:MAG: glycerol-3-phosphate dehydrogenase/oxidase [Bacillota bacterium]